MVSEEHLQPIRFQGQYFDEETGLHYNRFRYFDPDLGMFTTRDPIGLMGGTNVFAYAPNPTGWIDPFGLSSSAAELAANMNVDVNRGNLKPGQTAHHIVQENKSNIYTERSKQILTDAGIDHKTHSANGATLWGTGPNQVNQLGHPGKGTPAYHGGHVHAQHSDQRIMRLLERAEASGKPNAVQTTLRSIGEKMEGGRWLTVLFCVHRLLCFESVNIFAKLIISR